MNKPYHQSQPFKQFSAIAVRIVGAGFGFLATLLVSRYLGASDAGVFFASVTWAGFLAILARWGLQDVMLVTLPTLAERATVPQRMARVGSYFMAAVRRIGLILLALAVLWFVVGDMGLSRLVKFEIIAVLLIVTALLQLLSALAKSKRRPVLAFAAELAIPPVVVIGLLGFLVNRGQELSGSEITVIYAVAGLIGAMVLWVLTGSDLRPPKLRKGLCPHLANRGRTFAVSELSLFVSAFAGVLIMPFVLGAQETGSFNLSLRMAAVASLVPATVVAVSAPPMAKAKLKGDTDAQRSMLNQARIIMATSAAVYLIAVVLIGPWVLDWAGSDFVAVRTPLFIMAAGFAGGLLFGPSGVLLMIEKRERVLRDLALWTATISFVVLVFATLAFGLIGAATVVGATFFLHRAALFLAERRQRPSK